MAAKPPRTLANAGYADYRKLPRGPNGMILCRWCGTECANKQRTFCSGRRATFVRGGGYLLEGLGCIHEHCLRSDPSYARRCVWARDRGKCALCATVAPARVGHTWHMDHIIPVIEGGGSCGLENLRTLCIPCHKKETAKLAARRAEARRASLAVEPKKD